MTYDLNADGSFTVTDVILLQKWLLAVPDTVIAAPETADAYADGRIDILDLAVLKRALLNG